VTDGIDKTVNVVDSTGGILGSWQTMNGAGTSAATPRDIALHNDSQLFITVPNSGQLQIFDLAGNRTAKLVFTANPNTEEQKRPRSVAIEATGHLLVSDKYALHRYQILFP